MSSFPYPYLAAEVVSRSLPAARFVVGGGEGAEGLRRLTWELGIGDRVCFAGVRAELPSIYADLDVMALTSRNEGTAGALSVAAASRGLIRLRRRSG